MPEYKLSILIEGADHGAASVLQRVTGGMGVLNVALGTLVADGIRRATGALIDFGKAGLGVATDYQSSLNMFQAVSGATGDQMAQIGAEAKRLGADMTLPATSAGDAARAMTELAKAGLSVNNALLAGKGTLQLAAAGALDEARAAEIASNALNSFGLTGDKATMVADLFAAAANKSSVEVGDLADAFKMSSAVFSAFQGPIVGSEKAMKDLTTSIAILGNVGIKGSDAGTSLKQMLLQLTGPSSVAKDQMKALMYAALGATGGMDALDKIIGGKAKDRADGLRALASANPQLANMGDIAYDAAGHMRPLQEIIQLVTVATKGMSDEQRNQALTTIFGADATRAIIGLMRAGPEAFNQMETAISQQGAAADLAGARMKGLGGAWEGFKSTLETTQLTVMEPLLPALEQGTRGLAAALADATPAMGAFVQDTVVPAIAHVGALLDTIGQAPGKVSGWIAGVQSMIDQSPLATAALGTLRGGLANVYGDLQPVIHGFQDGGLVAALRALPGVIVPVLSDLNDMRGGLVALAGEGLAQAIEKIDGGTGSLSGFATTVREGTGLITDIGRELGGLIGPLSGAASGFGEMLGPHIAWLTDFANTSLLPALRDVVTWLGPNLQGAINVVSPLLTGLADIGLSLVEVGLRGIAIAWNTLLKPAFEALGGWIETTTGGWNNLARGAGAVRDTMREIAQAIRELSDADIARILMMLNPAGGALQSQGVRPPGFASGVTNFRGGLALVGERGPELVNLPGGSSVIPNSATRGLLAGGGGGGLYIGQVVIQEASDARETARAVREELIKLGKRNRGLGGIFGGYA